MKEPESGKLDIPIEEDDIGEFSTYNSLKQAYYNFCRDCGNYKIGNILRDSKTKKLIFICGDCFEKRIEKRK